MGRSSALLYRAGRTRASRWKVRPWGSVWWTEARDPGGLCMSAKALPEVSVIVPLHDEEENVAPLCEALRSKSPE